MVEMTQISDFTFGGPLHPCLILAGVFPLEAFGASFPAQPMVEMPHSSAFTFGGLVQLAMLDVPRWLQCSDEIPFLDLDPCRRLHWTEP